MNDPTLPIHPRTGLHAIGITGDRPVWPVIGGAEDDSPADAPEADDTEDTPGDDKTGEDPKSKPEPFDPERHAADLRKKNAENLKLRKQLKDLEPLAKKAKELEDANKSETERLTERSTSAETRATKAETDYRRLNIALDKAPDGMSKKQVRSIAARLHGETDEELEADAEELFSMFGGDGEKKDPPPVKGRPREEFRGGADDPAEEPEETDPAKLADLVPRRR